MKKFIALTCMIAGFAITFVQLASHLYSFSTPPWMSTGLSGTLIFTGIIVLGIDIKSRSRTIEP